MTISESSAILCCNLIMAKQEEWPPQARKEFSLGPVGQDPLWKYHRASDVKSRPAMASANQTISQRDVIPPLSYAAHIT